MGPTPSVSQPRAATWIVVLTAAVLPLLISPVTADAYFLPKLVFAWLAVLVLLVILASTLLRESLHLRRTALDLPLLSFIGSALLSTIFAVNANLAFFGSYGRYQGFLTILLYALLFWLATQALTTVETATLVVRALLAAAFVVSLLSILQVAFGSLTGLGPAETGVSFGGFLRGYGTFGNPNALGAFLAMMLPLAVREAVVTRALADRVLTANLALVLTVALVLTFSRTAWGAGGLGAALVFLLAVRPRVRLLIAVGCIVLAAVFLVWAQSARSASEPGVVRATQGRLLSLEAPLGTSSGQFRLHVWLDTIGLIQSRPLIGYGPDTFGLVYPRFQTGNWAPGYIIDRAHAEPLDITASQGLLGLAAYIAILAAIVVAFLRSRRDLGSVALGGGVVAYIGCTTLNFSYVSSALPFWIFLAAAITIWNPGRRVRFGPKRTAGARIAGIAVVIASLLAILPLVVLPLVADTAYRSALAAAEGGRPMDAEARVRTARGLDPWQAPYAVLAGTLALAPGGDGRPAPGADLVTARLAFLDAVRLGTLNAATYRNLAIADAELGLHDEAVAAARKAVELNRFDPDNQTELNQLR